MTYRIGVWDFRILGAVQMVAEMSLRGCISVSVGSLNPTIIILFGPILRCQMGDLMIGTRTNGHQSYLTYILQVI
jgi:hypothetical protein